MKYFRIALLTIFLILSAGVIRHLEIGGWDEGLYTRSAYFFEFLEGDWAPIYSFYLAMFRPFVTDSFWLFYLSRSFLLFILFPLSLYQFVRTLTKDSDSAIACALGLPLVAAVFQLDPGVHIFNICIVSLVFVAFSERRKWYLDFLGFIVLGSLPFIRQDNLLYIFGLFGFAIVVHRKRWWGVVPALASYAVISSKLGTAYSSSRSLYAFCDHWFWNHENLQSVGDGGDRIQVVLHSFGSPASLRELITSNFEIVLPYLFNHFLEFIRQFGTLLLNFLLLPIGIVILVFRKGLKVFRYLSLWHFVFIFVFVRAAVLSSLLTPKLEYYSDLYILGMLISIHVFMKALFPRVSGRAAVVLVLTILWVPLVYWIPNTQRRDSLIALRTTLEHELSKPIREIAFMGVGDQAAFLGPNRDSDTVFALRHIHFRKQKEGPSRLTEFAKRNNISAIVIGPEFLKISLEMGTFEIVDELTKDLSSFQLLESADLKIYLLK